MVIVKGWLIRGRAFLYIVSLFQRCSYGKLLIALFTCNLRLGLTKRIGWKNEKFGVRIELERERERERDLVRMEDGSKFLVKVLDSSLAPF